MTVKEVIYSNSAKRSLRNLLGQLQPEIAHAHNIYGRLTTSVLDVLKEAGIPIIMTLHDMKLLCPNYLMLNHGKICEKCKGKRFHNAVITRCHKNSYTTSAIYALETWLNHFKGKYNSIKYFIAPSQFLLQKHIEYGFPPEKLFYIPNFIDTKKISMSSEIGSYLLYFGRLSSEKGIKTLLKAFRGLKLNTSLLVVGDGPDRKNLEALAVKNVRFLGYLKGKFLFNAISNAKCVIVPSECYENSPLSVLESMAFGKPVIGSRIGGIPELIQEDKTGFLYEPGNTEALKNKIELMLNKTASTIKNIGKSAREKVEKEYSAESHYQKLMEVYEKALE
jgi:glycosyltransferase involved in cell wall biosynthesis